MSRLFFVCCIIAALVVVAVSAGCVAWRIDATVMYPAPSIPERLKDIENEREKKDAAAPAKG